MTADLLGEFLSSGRNATPMMNGNTPWAHAYAQHIKALVARQAARAPRSQQVHIGPSELGVACDRQVVGKLVGEARTNHVIDPWPSVVGTAVHAWLADAFTADDPQRWMAEHRVTPMDGHDGTADLYDVHEATVGDHKVLGASSIAKVKRVEGPPRHYQRQLALYGLGYLRQGYPVRRIALLAYPRTEGSLANLYVWEHAFDDEVVAWLEDTVIETQRRKRFADQVVAGALALADVPREPSHDECYFCVTGDTEVVTAHGIRPIASLVGTATLLRPAHRAPSIGAFVDAPVRAFGQQPTYAVHLRRYKARKIVRTTADHRWFDHAGHEVRTKDLVPGVKLASSKAPVTGEALNRTDVARGFVFGDGTIPQGNRPGTLSIYKASPKLHMRAFFDLPWQEYGDRFYCYGIDRGWKNTPSGVASLSWLAGYFAADGNVHSGRAVISSAVRENLDYVRDVAVVAGIRYGRVGTRMRKGFGDIDTPLYDMALDTRDLPGWFWLNPHHAVQLQGDRPRRETHWSVVSAEPTGGSEAVFCATDIDRFVLADGITTGNCPFYRPQAGHVPGLPGCPGTVAT